MPKRTSTEYRVTKHLAPYFDSRVRSRGETYYRKGRITLHPPDEPGVIEATARGGADYSVTISIDPTEHRWLFDAYCTCPYGTSFGGFCKHIWGTLLALEQDPDQRLRNMGSPPCTVILADDEDIDSFDDEMPELDDIITAFTTAFESQGLTDATVRITSPRGSRAHGGRSRGTPWQRILEQAPTASGSPAAWRRENTPIEPIYVLDRDEHLGLNAPVIRLVQQHIRADGTPGQIKPLPLSPNDIPQLAHELDRRIGLLLLGAGPVGDTLTCYGEYGRSRSESAWIVPPSFQPELFPLLAATGRLFRAPFEGKTQDALGWDAGGPWEFVIRAERVKGNRPYTLVPYLRRGDERRSIGQVEMMIGGAAPLIVCEGLVRRLATEEDADWLEPFRSVEPIPLKKSELPRFLTDLSGLAAVPPIEWPANWGIEEITDCEPQPQLSLTTSETFYRPSWGRTQTTVAVRFHYENADVDPFGGGRLAVDPQRARFIHRQLETEQRLLNRLFELGITISPYEETLQLHTRRVPEVIARLLDEGWIVFADRKQYRRPGNFRVDVTRGLDWFDVNGQVDFDGRSARLPELLAAARKGESFIRLNDGTYGMLPESWLAQHRKLLDLGRVEDGSVRFSGTQIGLVDALLADMPEANVDEQVAAARLRLTDFAGISAVQEPPTFAGELRPYQREGLGWLAFLDAFGWGGCLADDMGLGKTVQVLACLAERKSSAPEASLVVAPKSLVFNWEREAARFAPELRVLTYIGTARKQRRSEIQAADLVLTTYGTLRRDVDFLSKQTFDYVVLDEAQAIKNPESVGAKASRCLRARRRLALTGTPVENHLGDLWSIVEFLNPGMLGSRDAFRQLTGAAREPDENGRDLARLNAALRPFILRRTKAQVAPELPERSEQTVHCELSARQARCYRELCDHYRASLLKRIEKNGMARSKMHVLEALLRLRQAACHPGLIDPSHEKIGSAKLETLLAMLDEIMAEGHKILVYSQFTKMLGFVRKSLDQRRIAYEYLDGRTRDRASRVDRFQEDPDCPLFLISLKAGGVGLNLTAAEYVILLDPWWNPAVEAQAIDRTHRIGQDKKVIAYRLIARDTVEEKILTLQQTKRELAEAIITEQNSLIRSLTRDDLSTLLS